MDIQRLRNITTGRLHTSIGDAYIDIDYLTGSPGVMTHMIPTAIQCLEPWLRQQVPDPRFWNGEFDVSHVGDIEIEPMCHSERDAFFERFKSSPSLLDGKHVIVET